MKRTWLDLLLALPRDWPGGTIEGVRCRGQIEVRQLAWNGDTVRAVLRSDISQSVKVRFAGQAAKAVPLPKRRDVTVELSREPH